MSSSKKHQGSALTLDTIKHIIVSKYNHILTYCLGRRMEDQFDENAAMEAAFERNAVPRVRSALEVERDRVAKGHTPDIALEKWGPEIEDQILRDLETH